MWATDLKSRLKGSDAARCGTCCVLYAARARVLLDTMPRLKDDTHRYDMLLANSISSQYKGGEHKGLMGGVFGGSSSDCERERHTRDNRVE